MDSKETILYTATDFVDSDKRAEEFRDTLSTHLIDAQTQIYGKGLPIKVGLKTTVTPGLSEQGREDFNQGIRQLHDAGVDYKVDTWPSGPTRTMYEVLFDQGAIAAGFKAIATTDLDLMPPHLNLEKVLELEELVGTNKVVLGVGSRNVPVVLSANPENAYLRRIFEGFMNFAVKRASAGHVTPHKIISFEEFNHSDLAYKSTGDFITGAFLFHPSKRNQVFAAELVQTARQNNFYGFEDEYAMAIHAAITGDIAAVSFNCDINRFEPVPVEDEKKKIIQKQIQAPLKKLSSAGFTVDIHKGIDFGRATLSQFYPQEQIDEVVGYMEETLFNSS